MIQSKKAPMLFRTHLQTKAVDVKRRTLSTKKNVGISLTTIRTKNRIAINRSQSLTNDLMKETSIQMTWQIPINGWYTELCARFKWIFWISLMTQNCVLNWIVSTFHSNQVMSEFFLLSGDFYNHPKFICASIDRIRSSGRWTTKERPSVKSCNQLCIQNERRPVYLKWNRAHKRVQNDVEENAIK